MAMAYPNSVVTEVPSRKKSAVKKQQKAPKPAKPPKKKKPKKHNTNPLLNPTMGPAIPATTQPSTPSTPTQAPVSEFETLADLYREIFGPQLGFTPETSQSGESVLVVPGEDSESGSNRGLIILVVLVLAGGGYYLYRKNKKVS